MTNDAFTPVRNRVGRRRKAIAPSSPTPVALALVAAIYEEDAWVRLTFDRAIDISGIVASQVHVSDGNLVGAYFDATGSVNQVNATTVQIELEQAGTVVGSDTFLIASAATGIVAVDDGGTWSGTSDTELPYGD